MYKISFNNLKFSVVFYLTKNLLVLDCGFQEGNEISVIFMSPSVLLSVFSNGLVHYL